MLLAEFSIWPMDKGVSVGKYVGRVLDLIDRSGLAYKLGPLGTCVEGEPGEVLELIRRCHEALEGDCERIACTVKMDWRRGRVDGLGGKVASVERHVGRELKK